MKTFEKPEGVLVKYDFGGIYRPTLPGVFVGTQNDVRVVCTAVTRRTFAPRVFINELARLVGRGVPP